MAIYFRKTWTFISMEVSSKIQLNECFKRLLDLSKTKVNKFVVMFVLRRDKKFLSIPQDILKGDK